jgi:serine/threonine-protein kinase HipA
MNVEALGIFLPSGQRVGVLFRYELATDTVTTRFVADDKFIALERQPTISSAYVAESPEQQEAFWRDVTSVPLNGQYSATNGWLLPAFFQNLLPEGVFRDHIALQRGCDPKDHFEMLAACGKDLPGGIYALPIELSHQELSRYVTQDNDALEMSVTAAPLEEGVSLSGVQPKVGAIKDGDRYVGRTKDHDTHVIVKLPVVGQPLLPEVEDLSLKLAQAAGVNTCTAYLEPLEKLTIEHGYDLGDANAKTQFLAVQRFDRRPQGRVHCEDFAQVLGIMPEDKYGALSGEDRTSYLEVAAIILTFESMGEPAVHELLRRLVVNELLGNPDMHLKNIGLLYEDGKTPRLSPAYDIVAYAAYNKNTGHALQLLPKALVPKAVQHVPGQPSPKQQLSPAVLRAFCGALGILEKPAAAAIADAVKKAYRLWPEMILSSSLTRVQKERLLHHFNGHSMVESLARRSVHRTDIAPQSSS